MSPVQQPLRDRAPGRCRLMPALLCALVVGCGAPEGEQGRIEPVYDAASGRLQLLKFDANRDGTIDTWSYMDAGRIIRIELDADQNQVIDRWEYYGPDQAIEKVGSSSLNDG